MAARAGTPRPSRCTSGRIAILEKTVGLESPEIASALNNLAALYQRQERYAEAEPLFKRALAIRERSLGPGHPDIAQSLNNLATHYEKQGRHDDFRAVVQARAGDLREGGGSGASRGRDAC